MKQKEDFGFHRPVGVRLGQAPHLAPTLFVGRDSEREEIAAKLRPVQGLQKQRRLVLGGMGGIGKTQLAIAYAETRPSFIARFFG